MSDSTLQNTAGVITKTGRRLATLDEWFRYAPPRGKKKHWKDGRSAKENARLWLDAAPCLPPGIADILRSCADVGILRSWHAEPETEIPFDSFRGPANIDLLLTCDDEIGPLVVAVEAKADEPFGDTIEKTLSKANKRLEKASGSKGVERVKNLAAQFGLSLEQQEVLNLRYQLFTLTAAALAEAERRAAQRAIVIIHEYVTSLTSCEKRAQNASDLDCFLEMVFGRQYSLCNGMIVGPIVTNGMGKLYYGKAQTIRPGPNLSEQVTT